MARYLGTSNGDASFFDPDIFDPDPELDGFDAVEADGDDNLQGFEGNDILQGYRGTDFILGGAHDDVIWGDTKSVENLSADDGTDLLWGEAGNDVLHGNAGDDLLIGGAGDDSLFGEGGNDTAVFSSDFGFYAVVRHPVVIGGGRLGYNLEIIDWRSGRPDGTDLVRADVEFLQFGGVHGVILTRDQVLARTDDYTDNTQTLGQVAVGGSANGTLEFVGDGDFFRVQLTAGATYQIDLLGADTGHGTLVDPYLSLWDGAGNFITDDDDAGVGRNGRLLFTPNVTANYFIEADEYSSAQQTWPGTYRVAVTLVAPALPGGIDDVLWRHTTLGTVSTADHTLGTMTSAWSLVGIGNTDGDADSDIVWQAHNGSVMLWEMQNGPSRIDHNLPAVGTSWSVAGLGDFDNDGDDDILWRNSDGRVLTWELEDNGLVRTHSLPSASSAWRIAGIGDFDGDGDDDIVWHHSQGQVVTWEMENDGLRTTRSIAQASGGWNIQGTGDFDRDGDDDLVWRNAEGRVTTWEMQDNTYVVNHNIESGGNSWRIYGVHDFDTDGDSDILWRNDNGTVLTWEMNGFGFMRTHNVGPVSTAWQIRGVGDFDLA